MCVFFATSSQGSERAYQQQRAEEVAVKCGRRGSVPREKLFADARTSGFAEWTNAHEKELKLQTSRVAERRVAAVISGELLPKGMHATLRARATDTLARARKARMAREKKETKIKRMVSGARPGSFTYRGLRVWFDPSFKSAASLGARKSIRRGRGRIVVGTLSANTFVVKDPAALPQGALWAIALKGGRACTLEYISNKGKGQPLGPDSPPPPRQITQPQPSQFYNHHRHQNHHNHHNHHDHHDHHATATTTTPQPPPRHTKIQHHHLNHHQLLAVVAYSILPTQGPAWSTILGFVCDVCFGYRSGLLSGIRTYPESSVYCWNHRLGRLKLASSKEEFIAESDKRASAATMQVLALVTREQRDSDEACWMYNQGRL